jgi:phosphoglycolate phosphatase-like HAD superfamily hydrolase
MKRYIIFDFDQTLVNSKHLAEARRAKRWDFVESNVNTVQLFDGIQDVLIQTRALGFKIGVVTTSTRRIFDAICDNLSLTFDVTVCYDDIVFNGKPKAKPYPDGISLALAKLGGFKGPPEPFNFTSYVKKKELNQQAISVGDVWSDIEASRKANIESIAVFYGADDTHELTLAQPDYIAETPAELNDLIQSIAKNSNLSALKSVAKKKFRDNLWTRQINHGSERGNLRDGQTYFYARKRWKDGWSASFGNSLVNSFKIQVNSFKAAEYVKKLATRRFADELGLLLPKNANVIFLKGSKIESDALYDNRWDLLETQLTWIRRDISVFAPITMIASQEAAHESTNNKLRDPESIRSNLRWTSAIPQGEEIWVIDDVLTSGGHFEAYLRILNENAPSSQVQGAFWTKHMGYRP